MQRWRPRSDPDTRSRYLAVCTDFLSHLKLFFSNPLTGYFPVSCSAPRGIQASVGLHFRTSRCTAVSLSHAIVLWPPCCLACVWAAQPLPHVLLCMSRTGGPLFTASPPRRKQKLNSDLFTVESQRIPAFPSQVTHVTEHSHPMKACYPPLLQATE